MSLSSGSSCARALQRALASILLGDLKDAIAHFGAHPVTVGMRAEEAGGFNHL